NASSITVLEGLEAVRKRPGMYIGSTGERGLHHLVTEVVDNSVDEAMAGYASRVEVTLLPDGGVRVTDDGRGIPVDPHPKEKRPTVEVVHTVLHAVGVSVVNALSAAFDVEVHRDGKVWTQHYDHSKPGKLVESGATKRSGTITTFWPDRNIFESTHFSMETISRRLQEMAFLNK